MAFAIPEDKKHPLLGVFLATNDLVFSLVSFVMGIVVQLTSYTMMFITCTIVTCLADVLVVLKRHID